MRVMHQLPGRSTLPRWFRTTIAFGLTAVATVWMISLLPFLLLAALLISLILIPVLRRLRQDMDAAGISMDPQRSHRSTVDITPWHRQIRNLWSSFSSRTDR